MKNRVVKTIRNKLLKNNLIYSLLYGRYKIKLKLNKYTKDLVQLIQEQGYVIMHLNDFFSEIEVNSIYKEIEEILSVKSSKVDNTKTSFLEYYIGGNYPYEEQSISSLGPLSKIAINESILMIIYGYLNTRIRLNYIELNKTKNKIKEDTSLQSQNWHRDPGIRNIIKVFIYWNDVGSDSGPFEYVPKTHFGGSNYRLLKGGKLSGGSYYPSSQDDIEELNSKHISLVSPKGSIIICDTTGFHRGGNSKLNERIMSTFVYYPIWDSLKQHIKVVSDNSMEAIQRELFR